MGIPVAGTYRVACAKIPDSSQGRRSRMRTSGDLHFVQLAKHLRSNGKNIRTPLSPGYMIDGPVMDISDVTWLLKNSLGTSNGRSFAMQAKERD